MALVNQYAGDTISFSEFDKILGNLEVYRFHLSTVTINYSYTWNVDIKSKFGISASDAHGYEYGGILVPYRSYQTGGWYPRYNRWWTTQSVSADGIGKFTFNKQAAGYWGTPYNQKWFTIVLWCKPKTIETKRLELPTTLFEDTVLKFNIDNLRTVDKNGATVTNDDNLSNPEFEKYTAFDLNDTGIAKLKQITNYSSEYKLSAAESDTELFNSVVKEIDGNTVILDRYTEKTFDRITFNGKVGDIVSWYTLNSAQKATTSDTIKNIRFVPKNGGFTNIPFKNFFENFDVSMHKVGVCPSLQSLYTMEHYGAPANGTLTVNDEWEWLDVNHSGIGKGRSIEFLMFKGIRKWQ